MKTESSDCRSSEPAPSSGGELSEPQRVYYRAFVVALIICFSPLKAVAYAAPLLVTVLVWMSGGIRQQRVVAMVGVIVGLGALYDLSAPEFLLDTYILAVVTHSSLLPIVLVDGRSIASRELVRRIASAASWALLIEGSYGVVQAVYGFTQTGSFGGANGDYVEGTIHPPLSAELAFGNPMFATNVVLLLLACAAHPYLARKRWPFLAAGVLALVLASVVHVLVFMIAAMVLALALVYSRRAQRTSSAPRRQARMLVVGTLVIAALSYLALDTTVDRIANYGEAALDTETLEMPRAIMLYRVFADLPDDAPIQPWIGLGPGQFSSRASLLASGLYLGSPDKPRTVPLIEPKSTQLAEEYCVDLHLMVSEREGLGSTQQPFFSLLTIYTELGLAGMLVLGIFVFRILRQARRRAAEAPEHRSVLLVVTAGLLFILLLGLQQTYWEIPQAILVGCLALKALHAWTMYGSAPTTEPASREQSAAPSEIGPQP